MKNRHVRNLESAKGLESPLQVIRDEYHFRDTGANRHRYDSLRPENLYLHSRRWWFWASQMKQSSVALADATFLEVGCGTGTNLLEAVLLGATAQRVHGVDLINSRAKVAASRLGAGLTLGSATELPYPKDTFDFVIHSTMMSSLLHEDMRRAAATEMTRVLTPGGMILWCDLGIRNPNNPSVSPITIRDLRSLFPGSSIVARRGILAPPLARKVPMALPYIGAILETVPILCGHVLASITKPKPEAT